MRYYVFILLLVFFLEIVSVSAKNKLPLKNVSIVIDPGHGGIDPGTIYNDIYEKDINLSISLFLKNELQKLGADVYLIRDGDYDLSYPNAIYRKKSDFDNRISIINNNNFDIYLSIHLNYLNDSSYYGPQVFYSNKNDMKFANLMQNVLNKKLDTSRNIKLIDKSLYMYSKLNISGLLIECGFLSNSNDRNNLVNIEYQKKLSKIIAEGVSLNFS